LFAALGDRPPISASKMRYYGQDELLDIIARITGAHRGEGFICTVSDLEFEKWASASPQVAAWLGNPYSACVLYILGIVRNYVSELKEEAFYYLEAGANGWPAASALLERINQSESHRNFFRFRGHQFLPKEAPDALLLRSADLLASLWTQIHRIAELAEAEDGETEDPEWPDRFKLLFPDPGNPSIRHHHLSRGDLSAMALQVKFRGLDRNDP
jgi:hypothetical protein